MPSPLNDKRHKEWRKVAFLTVFPQVMDKQNSLSIKPQATTSQMQLFREMAAKWKSMTSPVTEQQVLRSVAWAVSRQPINSS